MRRFCPLRKSISASAFMSSGVARKTGEWSQVKDSPEVTLLPKTWLAEVAQRKVENCRQRELSPSARAASRWLEKLTAGSPYVCERNLVWCAIAQSLICVT